MATNKIIDFAGGLYAPGQVALDSSGNPFGEVVASGTITATNANANSGVPTANSTVTLSSVGTAGLVVAQVTGTYTGPLTLQTSVDGTNWVTARVPIMAFATGQTNQYIPTGNTGTYQFNCAGMPYVRLTALGAVTGTATVTMRSSPASGMPLANGTVCLHTVSAASTNSTLVKSQPGRIMHIYALNTNAAARYVKLYNRAAAPNVGTNTPLRTILVPANSSVSLNLVNGTYCDTGIGFAITTGPSDSDTGAVGAGDVIFDLDYL